MALQSETITISNRDVRVALSALEVLVKDRGVPDHSTAIALGKTIRKLRDAKELATESYDLLASNHARRDENGKIMQGAQPGSIVLDDQQAFFAENRKLDNTTTDVEIWPIACNKLKTKKEKSVCPRCKQLTGMPDPESYATLLDVGILVDDDADEGE